MKSLKNLALTVVCVLALVFLVQTGAHAAASLGGVGHGGHDVVTCTTSGVNIAVTENGQIAPMQTITLSNPTSTVVRVISNSSNAVGSGTPICNTVSCAGASIKLPAGSNVFKCATDSGTQSVFLLGGAP